MKNDYDKLLEIEYESLKKYSHECIGKTHWGEKIYCYYLGDMDSKKCILLQAGLHAREYITSFLLFKMMEYLSCFCFKIKLIFVPIMNKDGIKICTMGKGVFCEKTRKNINNEKTKIFQNKYKNTKKSSKNLKKIEKNTEKYKILIKNLLLKYDYRLFKSNGRGVDLNVNFDQDWGGGKHNFLGFASYQNYIGNSPFSERETRALASFTKRHMPDITLSFHSKGEVFYYGYFGMGKSLKKQELIYKRIIQKSTNYKPIFTKNSCGGYKDWCEMKLGIPSFTIEVGDDDLSHPIGADCLDEIFAKTKHLVLELVKQL